MGLPARGRSIGVARHVRQRRPRGPGVGGDVVDVVGVATRIRTVVTAHHVELAVDDRPGRRLFFRWACWLRSSTVLVAISSTPRRW